MTQDWNWFFSSLSQSAAAIVGIFGAFIITKIFSNQTSFLEKTTKIRQLLIQAKKITDDANSSNIAWHNRHYNNSKFMKFHDYLDKKFPAQESMEVINDEILDDFINTNTFSKYSEKIDIKKELIFIATNVFKANTETRESEEAADRAEAEFRKNPLLQYLGASETLIGMRNFNNMLNPSSKQYFSSYEPIYNTNWDEVTRESEKLEKSYLEAKHHSRLAAELLKSTEGNPESPRQISEALLLVLFIFFIGVIYPLSFMPATSAPQISISMNIIISHIFSFKGALLGIISIAFTAIVVVFYSTNYKMKYSPIDLAEIRELTNAKNYCTYFKFIDNTL